MKECVDRYITSDKDIAITLSKFVVHMGKSIREITERRAERLKFTQLMEETRKRMEGQDN